MPATAFVDELTVAHCLIDFVSQCKRESARSAICEIAEIPKPRPRV